MKARRKVVVLATAIGCVLAADIAAAQQPQPIALQPRVMMSAAQRDRVQAVANQGADALRQFLWRTRMIYGWTWDDLGAGGTA